VRNPAYQASQSMSGSAGSSVFSGEQAITKNTSASLTNGMENHYEQPVGQDRPRATKAVSSFNRNALELTLHKTQTIASICQA